MTPPLFGREILESLDILGEETGYAPDPGEENEAKEGKHEFELGIRFGSVGELWEGNVVVLFLL